MGQSHYNPESTVVKAREIVYAVFGGARMRGETKQEVSTLQGHYGKWYGCREVNVRYEIHL